MRGPNAPGQRKPARAWARLKRAVALEASGTRCPRPLEATGVLPQALPVAGVPDLSMPMLLTHRVSAPLEREGTPVRCAPLRTKGNALRSRVVNPVTSLSQNGYGIIN